MGPSDFFGSEILPKSDYFGSMKDAGIVLGHTKKKKTEGFVWVVKKGLRYFWGYRIYSCTSRTRV